MMMMMMIFDEFFWNFLAIIFENKENL
jgi:hypothetical protein